MESSVSPDEFRLFPHLSVDAQSAILNKLSFRELNRFCSTNLYFSNFCSDPKYLQQRLVNHGVGISNYQKLLTLLPPKDAYVKTLIDTRSVNKDPAVVNYIAKSNVLFPGVEYFIGLGKMGLRAIKLDSSAYLLYVLKLYPNSLELREIAAHLFLRYMRGLYQNSPILPMNMMQSLFRFGFEDDWATLFIDGKYYPDTVDNYRVYMEGLNRLPSTTQITITPSLDGSHPFSIYVYGLVDGKHDDLFIQMYSKFPQLQDSSYLAEYVASNGTVEMMKLVASNFEEDFTDLLLPAIESNNIPVVEYLTDEQSDFQFDLDENKQLPRSIRMVNLIRSRYGIDEHEIFLGACNSGNYDLLDMSSIPLLGFGHDVESDIFMDIMSSAPGYMIDLYFNKHRDAYFGTQEGKSILDAIVKWTLASRFDFYRTEIFLRLGYQPKEQENREGIKGLLLENPMVNMFGLDLERYPHLNRLPGWT